MELPVRLVRCSLCRTGKQHDTDHKTQQEGQQHDFSPPFTNSSCSTVVISSAARWMQQFFNRRGSHVPANQCILQRVFEINVGFLMVCKMDAEMRHDQCHDVLFGGFLGRPSLQKQLHAVAKNGPRWGRPPLRQEDALEVRRLTGCPHSGLPDQGHGDGDWNFTGHDNRHGR